MSDELSEWIAGKIAEAEQAVRARKQAEADWKIGDDRHWELAAMMHPTTSGKPPIKKEERLKISAAQGRIAEKCQRDLEMLKRVADDSAKLKLVGIALAYRLMAEDGDDFTDVLQSIFAGEPLPELPEVEKLKEIREALQIYQDAVSIAPEGHDLTPLRFEFIAEVGMILKEP